MIIDKHGIMRMEDMDEEIPMETIHIIENEDI